MKEVAIIYTDTRNGNAIDYIEGSLKDIFADHIRLKRYFLNQLDKGCLISADAVLLNGEKLLYTAQPYLSRTDNIVVRRRAGRQRYAQDYARSAVYAIRTWHTLQSHPLR